MIDYNWNVFIFQNEKVTLKKDFSPCCCEAMHCFNNSLKKKEKLIKFCLKPNQQTTSKYKTSVPLLRTSDVNCKLDLNINSKPTAIKRCNLKHRRAQRCSQIVAVSKTSWILNNPDPKWLASEHYYRARQETVTCTEPDSSNWLKLSLAI